jgi:succinate dehydrogenase / fumarate reductase cytochrome b subunit
MSGLCEFYSRTVGKKIVMAISGLLMAVFVIAHMAGNLKMFAGVGEDGIHKIDHYAEMLENIAAGFLGEYTFLWISRAGLLFCVVVHIVTAISLQRRNTAARPVGYAKVAYLASNPASRSMLLTGLLLTCFIIFHILHLTTGHLHSNGFQHGAVYSNVVNGFANPLVAWFYIAAMAALGLHLFHGFWSLFQTLGIDTPQWNTPLRRAAKTLAFVIFVGFSSVPVAALLGKFPAPIAAAQHQHSVN